MKDKPEIVKILEEEEKLGRLHSSVQSDYENLQMIEKPDDIKEDSSFFDKEVQQVAKEIGLESINETYRTVFENYAVAVTLADKDERIISWNKYAEELLQMNEKDMFLRNVRTLYPPEEWDRIRQENIRQNC